MTPSPQKTSNQDPLVRVCDLLNQFEAKYLIIGGHACILHGLVRNTVDVDILVHDSEDNFKKVIEALSKMEDGAAAELTPSDIAENVVVKVADEVEVDISRSAWQVNYEEALPTSLEVEIDGIKIPYLGLEKLILSKETYRDRDKSDLAGLKRLQETQNKK